MFNTFVERGKEKEKSARVEWNWSQMRQGLSP